MPVILNKKARAYLNAPHLIRSLTFFEIFQVSRAVLNKCKRKLILLFFSVFLFDVPLVFELLSIANIHFFLLCSFSDHFFRLVEGSLFYHCNFLIRKIIEFVNQPVYFSFQNRGVGLRICLLSRQYLFYNFDYRLL